MGAYRAIQVTPYEPQQQNTMAQLGQILQLRNAQQQYQAGAVGLQNQQLQLQRQKMMVDSQNTVREYFQNNPGADFLQAAKATQGKVLPEVTENLINQHDKMQTAVKTQYDLIKAQHDALAPIYDSMMKMDDETLAQNWPAIAQQVNQVPGIQQKLDPAQPMSKAQLQQYGPVVSLTGAYLDKETARQKAQADALEAQTKANVAQRSDAATQLASAFRQGPQAYAAARGKMPMDLARQFPDAPQSEDEIVKSGMTPEQIANQPVEKIEMKDWLARNPGKTPADFMRYKATLVPAYNFAIQTGAAGGSGSGANTDWGALAGKYGISAAALDQAAEKYAQTGQLPPSSRAGAGQARNTVIMNRAAALHPEANLAANAASYGADKGSLAAIQKNLDSVTAFENTAGKNLDMFLNTAKKVVDSGSPWINSPLRAVDMKGLGSADLSAFNAARQVAINEIAKVTGNPGLSGQLSDSARHEVEAFIPQNATLKQIYAVASTLKQDMANRHTAYADQIKAIKDRMGGKTEAPKADPLGIR